jgi:RluA family pseudouridine synthase
MNSRIEVTSEDTGLRLDKFLAFNFPKFQRSQLKKQIQSDQVKVNGKIEFHPQYRVQSGDKVEIKLPETSTNRKKKHNRIKPNRMNLDIIFEDGDLLVVNKRTGVATDQGTGNYGNTLLNGVKDYLQRNDDFVWGEGRTGLVHRLDKPTSGVVVFAKNPKAQTTLARLFADREVKKHYLAVVKGKFPQKKEHKSKIEGKPAKTSFEFVEISGNKKESLVLAIPETGRKHQIRIHLSELGFPIVGDRQYGGAKSRRLLLHAWQLSFPWKGETVTFEVPLPEYF